MPPNGVLGLGLGSGGKALAGDWGLLKAELSEVGKPCMLWVWDVAVPPRLREAMPDSGSICRSARRVFGREWWMSIRGCFFLFFLTSYGVRDNETNDVGLKIPVRERWRLSCWCWGHVPLALPRVAAAWPCSSHYCSWQPWSGSSPTAPGKRSCRRAATRNTGSGDGRQIKENHS